MSCRLLQPFQSCACTSATHALCEPRRHITRLYTSFYKGDLFPNQMVVPKSRLPLGTSVLMARQGKRPASQRKTSPEEPAEPEGVTWKDAASTDLVHMNEKDTASSLAETKPLRPYVPLGEVAKLELQGDYLTEGGLHQEALEFYGVVAKAYELAYPAGHTQQAGILIKLAGAFRRTNRLESGKANAERALQILDGCAQPSLELIVEALLELGLTKEALGEADAGHVYEEAVSVVRQYHHMGDSHRMLRLLPRLGRRFNLNHEQKFLYFSPFDYDRTFALADQCLARAEQFYDRQGGGHSREDVVRVLTTRKELMDQKFFNMRDFAGRIHTMRGHWMRKAKVLTNAPTPEELLRYSPTIHQVHRDFKYELNAPIGREKEVQQGVNRVVMDMGNPYRRRRSQSSRDMLRDADNNFAKYVRAKEYNE